MSDRSTDRRRAIALGLIGGAVAVSGLTVLTWLSWRHGWCSFSSTFSGTTPVDTGVHADETSKEQTDDLIPENANEHCPGVQSSAAGTSAACSGCPNQSICASGAAAQPDPAVAEIQKRLEKVKHKIVVLSGKGGVGKSTVSAQLAWLLQSRGLQIGLMDVDICGPSIPRMTGTMDSSVHSIGSGWAPTYIRDNLAVMSVGYLLSGQDAAVIWRGPKKNGLIRQFFTDVAWGELDFLIIDTPPGTTDEHLSVVTYLREAKLDGAILVTTPQEVSLQDVRREITFCKTCNIPVLGVVENMAGSIFDSLNPGATKLMCESMGVPYAGKLTLNPGLLRAGEEGKSVFEMENETATQTEFIQVVGACLSHFDLSSLTAPDDGEYEEFENIDTVTAISPVGEAGPGTCPYSGITAGDGKTTRTGDRRKSQETARSKEGVESTDPDGSDDPKCSETSSTEAIAESVKRI